MDILQVITQELGVEKWQVEAAVKLIDEGNTIPFISRYRKEATGTLNDEQLRNLNERLTYLRNLEDKKKQVLSSIEDQGKLTEELKAPDSCSADTCGGGGSLPSVPPEATHPCHHCQRKRSGAAGKYHYAPDDEEIRWKKRRKPYVSEEKEVASVEEAIAGAKDIIAEQYF